MALYATAKEPAPQVEAGSYTVKCMDIREDKIENSQFNPEVYRLTLETEDVLAPDGSPVHLDAICSRTLSPKSKLWRWLTAFGLAPEVGKRIDLEDVVERSALAIVINKESEGGVFSRVDDIVPLPARRRAASVDLAEGEALAEWFETLKKIGYTPKEILERSQQKYGKAPAELSTSERDALSKEMTEA